MEQHRSCRAESSPAAEEEFVALADDLEAVWNSPRSDARLKKRIVRTLMHEVIADIDHDAGEVVLVIHWKGGVHTELRVPRRRRRGSATRTNADILAAVRVLVRVCSDRMIAGFLNRNGLKTGRGSRWTQERVTALRSYHKIAKHCPEIKEHEGWMNLTEAAAFLSLSSRTIRLAAERQDIPGEHPLPDGPWVFRRSDLESEAALRLVQRTASRKKPPRYRDAVSSHSIFQAHRMKGQCDGWL